MRAEDYPIEVRPLAEDDGGGFLATFPDLPGCMADGETPEAAIREALDAAVSWLATAAEAGDPIPAPGTGGESGRFVARIPKSLHVRLAGRARQEGVSLNTLVVALLAEGVERRVA
jgi:antitoxin HicB